VAGLDERDESPLGNIELAGDRYRVTCRIAWDGIEYVGQLWFADVATDEGVADRGTFPGRTSEEVRTLASRLTTDELIRRLARAHGEKRRFHSLHRATDEVIAKIRYLNKVVLAARAGLLDADGARAEIDLVEQQLHDMVTRLRDHAGVEG
jgi:hypothetical protein